MSRRISLALGVCSLAPFLALGFVDKVKAEGDSGSMVFSVNVASTPTIQITLPSTAISLNLRPSASTDIAFGKTGYNIEVGTSNPAGYTLSMTTNSTTLTNTAATPNPTIETLVDNGTTGYTEGSFTTNAWGYKPTIASDDTINYFAMKSSVPLDSYNTTTDSRITNLTFASKVDTTKPAGSYGTTLNFVAVANPVEYIQNLNSSSCTTVAPITVYDERDNTAYEVQRLADGRCWLLDNLALDIVNNINSLNKNNTNASNATLGYLKNGGGTTTDKWAVSGVSNFGSTNSYSNPLINTASKDATNATLNLSDPLVSTVPAAANWKHGVYYNYCAASAGSYCYGDGTSEGTSVGNASEDICPAGWRMPSGGANGEYQALAKSIILVANPSATYTDGNFTNDTDSSANYYDVFRMALHVPLPGYFNNGSIRYQGSAGYFSASTRYSNSSQYTVDVNTITVYPQNHHNRNYGFSVRCVMKEPSDISEVTTMQQFGNLYSTVKDTIKGMMATYDGTDENAVYTLQDNRDSTTYHIAKLADGNVWMLDNLALDIVTNKDILNPTNTNASTDTLNALRNGGRTDNALQYPTSGVSNFGSTNSYSDPLINTANKDDTNATLNKSDPLASIVPAAANWKYGVYYNYCAASAGSYCYGNGTSAGTSEGNASEDICPAGWRMPTSGPNGEYQALAKAIILASNPSAAYTSGNFTNATDDNANYHTTFRTIFHAPFSGNFSSGLARNQGSYGVFWSSTRGGNGSIRYLGVDTTTVGPQNTNDRSHGRSVRCVLGS